MTDEAPGKPKTPEEQARMDLAGVLSDPWRALHAFGVLVDQETDTPMRYDAQRLTVDAQATVLGYLADPPRVVRPTEPDDLEDGAVAEAGETRFLVALKPRQSGLSTTAELGAYVKTAYTPGWEHDCIADTRSMAEYLHGRVHLTHGHWPEALRTPTISTQERNQLTFQPSQGGFMRVLSAERENVGIGLSPSSLHGSELPFWADAAKTWNYLAPSIRNRKNALVVLESTPAPAGAPSVEWWQARCQTAKAGDGRWLYAFFPFWDGKLNRRPWRPGSVPDTEELRLLEKYGPLGLTLNHLAFRREVMSDDPEVRRNPDLFGVFYPFDDLTCWSGAVAGAFPVHSLRKHENNASFDWRGPYMEFEPPKEGAVYAIGVDPVGFAARDHASFQVLEVWDDEWRQVACYADHTRDPAEFVAALLRAAERYNKPIIVVENNGVGTATLTLLREANYPNLYHDKPGYPGIAASGPANARAIAWTTDALLDTLVLNDRDTVSQLQSYRQDKVIEADERLTLIRGGKLGRNRRSRHHWDKVSALMLAVVGARRLPRRYRVAEKPPEPERPLGLYTAAEWATIPNMGEGRASPKKLLVVRRH